MGLACKTVVYNQISIYTEQRLRITCQLVQHEIALSLATGLMYRHVHKGLNKLQHQQTKEWDGMLVLAQVPIGTKKVLGPIGRQACSTWAPKTCCMVNVSMVKLT